MKDILEDNQGFPIVYAVRHKDERIRMESRSGGIFTALSDWVLDHNGIVYGCELVDCVTATHNRATTKEERNRFRGSKYIQSDMMNMFQEVRRDILSSRYVLFSGTSCQAAGLSQFLEGMDCTKLYLIDIVCHGVPSPRVWKDYINWIGKKHQGTVEKVEFRNKKKFGWRAHVETMCIKGREYDSSIFTKLYFQHNIIRPCCYECPYKTVHHKTDITIADFWGIDQVAKEFDDNKGVSLVLVNSIQGMSIMKEIQDEIEQKKCQLSQCMQPSLRAPYLKPKNRASFWRKYEKHSFRYIAFLYGGTGLKRKLKECLKFMKKNEVKI